MKSIIEEYRQKEKRLVIGLMSGTSADGVDAALVEIKGGFTDTGIKLLGFICYPYPEEFRKKLFKIFDYKNANIEELSQCNFFLGEIFARASLSLIKKAGLPRGKIDLIASHGQTVYHNPDGKIPSTLQIGEPAVIAELTGITTVADFRPADVALGGQGAPLVPYVDYILFAHPAKNRILLNIGGISNLTYLKRGCKLHEVLAFDTGPGNMIIDELVRIYTGGEKKYDSSGRLAEKGMVSKKVLNILLKHHFIYKKPPKSTGREDFGKKFTEEILKDNPRVSILDLITTATIFTAESICVNIEKFLPSRADELILCGGGSFNNFLVGHLKKKLKGVRFYKSDEFGVPSFAKEAVAFAILGNETILQNASNIPQVSGAKRRAVLGKVCFGGNE